MHGSNLPCMSTELAKSLILDGVAASTAIDSSGEQIDLDGLDITDLERGLGVLNYEHRGDKDTGASANDIIGAITYAKKIYALSDCANDRERSYWERVGLPFLYIKAELFNDEGHPGAVAAAALIRYYNRRKLPILMRYSIEGSTLERDGNVLKRCVARRVAATIKPCNRTCFSGVLADNAQEAPKEQESGLETLLRAENPLKQRLSSYELEIDPVVADPVMLLKNSLETLKEFSTLSKAIAAGGMDAAPSTLSGGSALQREDVSTLKKLRNSGLAALRDWDHKGDFRSFLKTRMPDASESFIDHFIGLVDDYHVKKQESLESDLVKAVYGAAPQGAAQIPGFLTVQGRSVDPVNVSSSSFDDREGVLVTPRGTFKAWSPSTQGPVPAAAFAQRLGDPKAAAFSSYVAGQWARLHSLAQQGTLPLEVSLHTALFNKFTPSTPLPAQDLIYGDLAQLPAEKLITDSSRYLNAMRGAGDGLVLDQRLVRHLFGLDSTLDTATVSYLHNLLEDPINEPALAGLTRHFNGHDAVRAALEDPRLKDLLQDSPEHGVLPGLLRAWIACDDDGSEVRPFWDAVGEFTELPTVVKSEGDLPLRTARLHRQWCQKHGEIPALMLYHAYIVPQLLHAAASRSILGKMQDLAANLKKAAGEDHSKLADLSKVPAGAHKFKGRHVMPGEVEVLAGPHKGSKLHMLGHDDQHVYVKPQTDDPNAAIKVAKLSKDKEGVAYKINRTHTPVVGEHQVHADVHGHPTLTQKDSQKLLMHGLDLGQKADLDSTREGITAHEAPEQTGWYQSASGQFGYVKPNSASARRHLSSMGDEWSQGQVSPPQREAIYHNLAHDFFGLGEHVPTTAIFKHPKTGKEMSIIQRVKDGKHYDSDDDDAQFAVHQAGETGQLDKLAMMDAVLGQDDRHDGNFMLTPHTPFVHHIDNGMIFMHGRGGEYYPSDAMQYYHDNHPTMRAEGHKSIHTTPIHPEAAKWVLGLNADDLHSRLLRSGVPEKFAHQSSKKLRAMQNLMWTGQPTRGDIFKIGGQ